MLNHQSPAARRLLSIQTPQPSLRLRSGGLVQGPGTSTSDSIPAKLSDGEFVLPADTVRKVGIKSLRDLVQRTHEPSGRQPRPGHFADGGIADDELRQRQNSFGDAAAAASNPALQQVTPPPAAPSAAPSPTNIFPGNRLPDGAGRTSSAQAPGLAPVPTPATADAPSVTERERLINQIPTDSYPNGPKPDGSMDNPLNSETGRNLQAIANSVAGLGGAVPALTKTGGAISSFLNSSAGAVRGAASVIPAAGGVATAASAGQGATDSRQSVSGPPDLSAINEYSQAPMASNSEAVASAPTQMGWDRTGMSNADVVKANPQGRVQVQRQADGTLSFSGSNVSGPVSYANGQGQAIAGAGPRGQGWGGLEVAPTGARVALDNGNSGSYVYTTGSTAPDARAPSQAPVEAPSTAGGAPAPQRLSSERSPVGMTVEQAQRQGLIGQAVGYNPAYDQRLMEAPQFNSPQVVHSGNDWEARKRLENLATSASSIANTRRWGGRGAEGNPSVRAYRAALDTDAALQQAQPKMDQSTTQANANLLQEGMQQAGSNRREGMRNDIERGKLSLQQIAAGYQNRSADRIDAAQADLLNAKTPEEQSAGRQRLLALMGKTDDAHWKPITLQGGTDAQGNKLESVFGALNERTGEMKRMSSQSNATAAYPEGTRVRGKDGRTYVVKDGRPVLVGG